MKKHLIDQHSGDRTNLFLEEAEKTRGECFCDLVFIRPDSTFSRNMLVSVKQLQLNYILTL